MYFIDEKPFAPYFIFIKGISNKSDKEILELLQISTSPFDENEVEDYGLDIYISRDNDWVHLMDNEFYHLWHSQKLTNKIEELGVKYEIFTCSVGEPDLSFDFRYFKNGKKVREHVVDSPNYDDQIFSTEFGSPITGEEILAHQNLIKSNPLIAVLHIAESLGIQLPKSTEGIKCYRLE